MSDNPIYQPYRDRNAILKEIGFASYKAYLQSDLWAGIRKRVLAKRMWCIRCRKRRARHVHHACYSKEALLGEDISRLHPVCGRCHKHAEIVNGAKGSMDDANFKLGVSTKEEILASKSKMIQRALKSYAKKYKIKLPNS